MAFVVVTGASGHVGANFVRALLARGVRVRVMLLPDDLDPESLRGLDGERVVGDVREPESLKRALAGAQLVVPLAAQIATIAPMGGLVHASNVIGARNVGEAARAAGARRMLHMCSVHAFDHAPPDPLDENTARVTR